MPRKPLITAVLFTLALALCSYLLLAAETLSPQEMQLIDLLEKSVAAHLEQTQAEAFPANSRITNKVKVGGDKPFIYKISATSGRPGKRISVGFSVVRTLKKAQGRFKTRWKHELRANSIGKLEALPIDATQNNEIRLAQIRGPNQKHVGMFVLILIDRGILSVVLKGITIDDPLRVSSMLEPTLRFLKERGSTLMVNEEH